MKRPKRDDFKRELYDGADMAEWFQDYYKALEKYADYLEAKAGQHETVVALIESTKLLEHLKSVETESELIHEIEQQISMNKYSALEKAGVEL